MSEVARIVMVLNDTGAALVPQAVAACARLAALLRPWGVFVVA